jgi:glycosyltransferase involved in cell wall biosynthesis
MTERAKLAYICHIFPHLTQTFVYWEVEELRRAGLRLTVFSMKRPETTMLSEECRYLIQDTIYLPAVVSVSVLISQLFWLLRAPGTYLRTLTLVTRGRYRYDNGPRLWLHGMVDFARGAHLARLIGRNGDFAHLHAQFADDACTTTLVASLLTGIAFSFRSHTSPNPQLIQEKLKLAKFVVSASLYDQRVLVHWCGDRSAATPGGAEKIHVNRLGVPLDRYQATDEGGESGAQERRFDPQLPTLGPDPLILSVGTLCAKKGFEYLVRACRLLADRGIGFRCLIVGDGPDRLRLTELITLLKLEDQVSLIPYRSQEELRVLYRNAAVFALPCIFPLDGNVDVIPLVLQEAMAMARPVVSTPISGIPELIQEGVNGLLAPEKDHEALAEALARLLTDHGLAQRLGRAGRETVERHFDLTTNGSQLARIISGEVPELIESEAEAAAVAPHQAAART